MVLGCSGFLHIVVPIPHKILIWGADRLYVLWCLGSHWTLRFITYLWFFCYSFCMYTGGSKKMYFQWVAVERKRNISCQSKTDRKILMPNDRCPLHSLDLAFLRHTKLSVSCVHANKRNLQMQLHCIIWSFQDPKGHFLSNKSLPSSRKHLWE